MTTDAQKLAKNKYRKAHRRLFVAEFNKDELTGIEELISKAGMNKPQFIRWGAEQLKNIDK